MPTLQIDGVPIAEIDEMTANSLRDAAANGTGRTPSKGLGPSQQLGEPKTHIPGTNVVNVQLVFPAPARGLPMP